MKDHNKRESIRSQSIARGADVQREAIRREREAGEFDAQKHVSQSPIGRAVAKGFPLAI